MGKSRLKNKFKLKTCQSAKKLAASKNDTTTLPNINPSPYTSVILNPKTTNTYDQPPSHSQVDHDEIKDESPSSTSQNPTYSEKAKSSSDTSVTKKTSTT